MNDDGHLDFIYSLRGPQSQFFWPDFIKVQKFGPKEGTVRGDIKDLNEDGHSEVIYANSGNMSRIYLNSTIVEAEDMLRR
jgi:hypothetical protein